MDPSVYAHLRPAGDDEDGIYRVVGVDEQTVTLLQVGDADGRRVTTGRVVTLDRSDLSGFEPAANPDGNRSLGETVGGIAEGAVWSVRAFASQLLANPLQAGAAFGTLLVGGAADQTAAVPDTVGPPLLVLGAVGLAYVGGGRF